MYGNVKLFIGDLHAPFQHKKTLSFLAKIKKKFNPTTVIQVGDMVDGYNFSKWPKGPNSLNSDEEIKRASEFITRLGELFPNLTWVIGNHDKRCGNKLGADEKTTIENMFHRVLPKGWKLVDGKSGYEVADGYGESWWVLHDSQKVTKANRTNHRNEIGGHHHTEAGIVKHSCMGKNGKETYYAANTGCLIDPDEETGAYDYFSHGKGQLKLGVVLVLDGSPMTVDLDETCDTDNMSYHVTFNPNVRPQEQVASSYLIELKKRCFDAAINAEREGKTFKDYSSNIYQAARKNGILEDCRKLCPAKKKPNDYYTKERCIEISKDAEKAGMTFKSFNSSAYKAARKNGWLEDCRHSSVDKGKDGRYYPTHWTKARRSA